MYQPIDVFIEFRLSSCPQALRRISPQERMSEEPVGQVRRHRFPNVSRATTAATFRHHPTLSVRSRTLPVGLPAACSPACCAQG
jgi:hypothetical protein